MMKNKLVISAVMALCLAVSGSAFAQQAHGKPQAYKAANWKHQGRGAGPRQDIHKGKYLPREYRGSHYVVNDWRGHRLSSPPRGYHWVQTGGDYVLVRISTGLIFQINLH